MGNIHSHNYYSEYCKSCQLDHRQRRHTARVPFECYLRLRIEVYESTMGSHEQGSWYQGIPFHLFYPQTDGQTERVNQVLKQYRQSNTQTVSSSIHQLQAK